MDLDIMLIQRENLKELKFLNGQLHLLKKKPPPSKFSKIDRIKQERKSKKEKISAIELYKRDKNLKLWEQIERLSKTKKPNYKSLLILLGRYTQGSDEPTELDEVEISRVHKMMKELLKLGKQLEKNLRKYKTKTSIGEASTRIEGAMKKLNLKGTYRTWPNIYLKAQLRQLDKEYNVQSKPPRAISTLSTQIEKTKSETNKLNKKKTKGGKTKEKLAKLKLKLHMLGLELKHAKLKNALRRQKSSNERANVKPMTIPEVFKHLREIKSGTQSSPPKKKTLFTP